jgi:tetratricopeptide (TPR) repeat protein
MKARTAIIALLCIAAATTLAYRTINRDWVIYRHAETLYKKKEYVKAIPYYSSLLEKGFKDPVALSRLGEMYLATSDLDKARSVYEEMLRNDPLNMWARVTVADIYMRLGQYERTVGIYTMLLRSRPKDRHLHILLARTLTAKGDFDGAINHYRIALGEER